MCAGDSTVAESVPLVVTSSEDYESDPAVWDLVVVGAGIAGSALAFSQAKDGRKVLLLERDLTQPDRIVGELLQPGGYLALKQLGLGNCVEGIDAQKVYGYALFKNGRIATVKYPLDELSDDVAGRSFHNGRFVQRLRQAASMEPNVTLRRGTVKRLLDVDGKEWDEDQDKAVSGVCYRTSDGEQRVARGCLTVVCDGMYSNLRKKFMKPDIKQPSHFVGLVLTDVELPRPNHGHVVLASPSPLLFYPISSTEVRCLIDIPGREVPSISDGKMQKYLREKISPQVPEALRAPFLAAVDGGDIRCMQNKQMASAPICQPGALLLGDAFNMRHPLTGGGMTVALSDTKLLCDMLQPLADLTDPELAAAATRHFFTRRKPVSATINTLANALYKVFCTDGSEPQEEMRQACFDYLSLGGIYSSGPISLLSGLNPRPSVLVAHFFMVALYGVGRLLFPRPSLRGLYLAFALLATACRIILPIIQAEGVWAVFFPLLAGAPRRRSGTASAKQA
uniref:Squalene monooxygenase n=1 Tax=Tetraselmis sp. GSL018 TaxID=582737 RepID=A0A061QZC0_9CHLO|mmetsp:Transcript_9656/g.23208  ORF Transcript_9656/g.23208 Transcript_9656/m.23208 type:complete len:508 (-) Transcript_9656:101-1624(-)|eukprot:CAMPEP_0177610276 /NCGR_PEP_ID=MMETSP0419_2-20121207/19670_1 /TAXON_ID=582737 /ORGANISM="Tetraselmis sp., Strain GSL018" /LENGTH=507 /DNA_ID=CAMNT_0019105525 /DNA_START=184 /DNA_END=1707 /DNA_ORIENTATION=+